MVLIFFIIHCIATLHLLFQGTFVEGIKEEVVLSPAHALSLIAAGEGYFLNALVNFLF